MSTRKILSLTLATALVSAPFAATAFAAAATTTTTTTTTTHHMVHHPVMHTTHTRTTTTTVRSHGSTDAAVDALNAQSLARARGGATTQ